MATARKIKLRLSDKATCKILIDTKPFTRLYLLYFLANESIDGPDTHSMGRLRLAQGANQDLRSRKFGEARLVPKSNLLRSTFPAETAKALIFFDFQKPVRSHPGEADPGQAINTTVGLVGFFFSRKVARAILPPRRSSPHPHISAKPTQGVSELTTRRNWCNIELFWICPGFRVTNRVSLWVSSNLGFSAAQATNSNI